MPGRCGFGGGLLAGMNIVAPGRCTANNTGQASSAAGVGQFVFEKDASLPGCDVDAAGGKAAIRIADLAGSRTCSGAELTLVA